MELETSEPFEVQAPLVGRSFSVAVQSDDEEVIAKISGELDLATFPIVQDQLRPFVGRRGRLVFELEEVSFMDSSVLPLFRDTGFWDRIVVRSASVAVRRLLALLEMDSIIRE